MCFISWYEVMPDVDLKLQYRIFTLEQKVLSTNSVSYNFFSYKFISSLQLNNIIDVITEVAYKISQSVILFSICY